MTSWRVLRLLAVILLVVCWFLVAWTSAVCERPDRRSALIDVGYTPDGLQFSMCLLDRWDYMTAVGKRRGGAMRGFCGVESKTLGGVRHHALRVPHADLHLLTREAQTRPPSRKTDGAPLPTSPPPKAEGTLLWVNTADEML